MKSWVLSAFPQMAHEGVRGPKAHCDSEAAALTQGSHRPPKETVQRFGRPMIRPWRAILCFWRFTHTPKGSWWSVVTRTRQSDVMAVGVGVDLGMRDKWQHVEGPSARSPPAQPTLHVHRTPCTRAPSPRWGPGPDHSPVSIITNHSTHLPWVLFVCFPAKSILFQLKKPGRASEIHKVV